MYVIVGLGNPGKEYINTRHNAGFLILDNLLQHFSFTGPKQKFQSELYEGTVHSQKVTLLKPQTYMNLSGRAVSACCQFYKIPLSQLLVIHDDLDLPLGKIRVKLGGGNGGHNGLKSIDQYNGPLYKRLRIGIGRPSEKYQVSDYVLSNFTNQEREIFNRLSETLSQHLSLLIEDKDAQFMNILATTSEV